MDCIFMEKKCWKWQTTWSFYMQHAQKNQPLVWLDPFCLLVFQLAWKWQAKLLLVHCTTFFFWKLPWASDRSNVLHYSVTCTDLMAQLVHREDNGVTESVIKEQLRRRVRFHDVNCLEIPMTVNHPVLVVILHSTGVLFDAGHALNRRSYAWHMEETSWPKSIFQLNIKPPFWFEN